MPKNDFTILALILSCTVMSALMILTSCTLTSEQRYHLISKEMDTRLELAKQPIATADEAKNLKVYSQDRTLPELPAPDVDKYLDATLKAGALGLGAYGIHELSHGGGTTNNTYNYATE